jgi:hypothetical protein
VWIIALCPPDWCSRGCVRLSFLVQASVNEERLSFIKVQAEIEGITVKTGQPQAGIWVTETWTAGVVVILDIMGICRVDGGLVVLELVSVDGLAARDSRPVGCPVTGSWMARRISCQRCRLGSVMILTPNRLWNISKVCVMQDKL